MFKAPKTSMILLLNDKSKYNVRYRSNLISEFEKAYTVSSCGCFDSFLKLLSTFVTVIFGRYTLVISSNLKSNLLNLIVFWRQKTIIINGLGRYRGSKFLRKLIIFLLRIQYRKNLIFVQNYADFRFFRKNSKTSAELCWMPGSGGTKRELGSAGSRISIITRDEKLPTQIESMREFLCLMHTNLRLVLVGVKGMPGPSLHDIPYDSVGYVDQLDILSFSNAILVPDGYGEGVPHTLVDAIVSGAEIFLSKLNYIQYGFYMYTTYELLPQSEHWVKLNVNDSLKDLVASKSVVNNVFRKVDSLIKMKE